MTRSKRSRSVSEREAMPLALAKPLVEKPLEEKALRCANVILAKAREASYVIKKVSSELLKEMPTMQD